MNKRIKELSEQAWEYARSYVADCKHYGYYMEHNELQDQFEQKFAELIVNECAMICYHSWFMDSDAHANNLLSEFNIDNCRDEK